MMGGIKVGAGPGQGQACLEDDEWNRDHDPVSELAHCFLPSTGQS